MNQTDEIKQTAQELRAGLKLIGPDRAVALSVHKTKALIAEMEQKAIRLVELIDAE